MAGKRKPISLAQVQQLASEGHTEGEIARRLGISQDTLTRRKADVADLADAIKAGQESAHSTVSNALFQQASKGNVTAIIWYEKTRRGFRDQQDITSDGKALAHDYHNAILSKLFAHAPPDPGADPVASVNGAGSGATAL